MNDLENSSQPPYSDIVFTMPPSGLRNDDGSLDNDYMSLSSLDQKAIDLLESQGGHPFYGFSNRNYILNYIRRKKENVGETPQDFSFYHDFLTIKGLTDFSDGDLILGLGGEIPSYGSGGKLPEFGKSKSHVGDGKGIGFSYEDIGDFFSMLVSPFVAVYDFFANLFESKPGTGRRYGFPRFGEKGSGGKLPEFAKRGSLEEFFDGPPAPGFKNADAVFDDVYNILMLKHLREQIFVGNQKPATSGIKNPLAAGAMTAAVFMSMVEILSKKPIDLSPSDQESYDRDRVGRNRAIAAMLGLGSLFTYLGYGEGGSLPEFSDIGEVSRSRGKLSRAERDALGRDRRSSMFGLESLFGVSAEGTHSLRRNQRNLNRKDEGMDFLDMLGLSLGIGVGIYGLSEFIKNNFGEGGALPEFERGEGIGGSTHAQNALVLSILFGGCL